MILFFKINYLKYLFKIFIYFKIGDPGFYDNSIHGMCQPCHLSCAECTGPDFDNCTKCFNDSFRNSGNITPVLSICACSSGYTENVPLARNC